MLGLGAPLDMAMDAAAPARGLDDQGPALRLLQGGEALRQPRLQGDGQAHRPGGPGVGEAGIDRAGRAAFGHAARRAPGRLGDLHPDLGQPIQHRHLPRIQGAPGRDAVGGGGISEAGGGG
ncbi:MAG: hypothetical protein B7Y99_03605 [Caulobacterales bacterium 32-69-10]|nr:MAG: hypothetical protein B7Y99_03605 [Caulobacterales bacterium 32-69-10]